MRMLPKQRGLFASPTACFNRRPLQNFSEPVVPGFSTFVESDNNANTLCYRAQQICAYPSNAINWGLVNLKSPV